MSRAPRQPHIAIGHFFYGLYAWLILLLVVLSAILFAVFVPGLYRRRRWVRAAAMSFFVLTAIRVRIDGLQRLPSDHCIVVANHASYIDGLLLQAILPPRFSFVIKGEVRNIPIVHFLLRRIGAKFVERFLSAGSSRDARILVKAAAAGESLAFFPEGTFIREPGLGRFRPGAFRAAIKGALPVVPLAIRGSRQILRAKTFMPLPGSLRIDILEPLETDTCENSDSVALTERARQSILTVLDEPDLLLAD